MKELPIIERHELTVVAIRRLKLFSNTMEMLLEHLGETHRMMGFE